jgi:hypothetical protein
MNGQPPRPIANDKKAWLLYFIYIIVLLSGLIIIECRNGWFWRTGGIRSRVPSAVALFNWVFLPEKMEYTATSLLKANQQIRRTDLAVRPELDKFLWEYLPALESRVGKYLKTDVAVGEPILSQNLSVEPIIKAETNSCLVVIRINGPLLITNLLRPEAKVALIVSNLSEQIEGTVVADLWEKPAPVSTGEAKSREKKGGG